MARQSQSSMVQIPSTQKSGNTSPVPPVSGSTGRIQPAIYLRNIWQQARKTLKGRFIVLEVSGLVLSVILSLVISASFNQANADLDTINSGSIPSVNAAQAMDQYINDIDAKAADFLATASLTDVTPCSIVGTDRNPGSLTVHECDKLNIDAEIILANQELFNAAHNVTYPGERTAVERITAGFEEYTADITLLRYEFDLAANKSDINDPHLQRAEQAYIAANAVLTKHITRPPTLRADGTPVFNETDLPACTIGGHEVSAKVWPLGSIQDNIDCLGDINYKHLSAAYNDTVDFLGRSLAVSIILCLIFCGLLFVSMGSMSIITHRVINAGLTLAVLVSLFFSISIATNLGNFTGAHGAFGQMVKDDYDSIYYAKLLKRYGTQANADESRWLLAIEFNDQANIDYWAKDWVTNTTQVRALITNAVNNRTWPEEDQPLADMQKYWNAYFQIDGQIRAKANNTTNPNHIIDAERLSTGDSNNTFGSFTLAVDQLGQANQGHYDITYSATKGTLTLSIVLCWLLFPLTGLSAAWGINSRLKDF